jgi:hypothetical protein
MTGTPDYEAIESLTHSLVYQLLEAATVAHTLDALDEENWKRVNEVRDSVASAFGQLLERPEWQGQ